MKTPLISVKPRAIAACLFVVVLSAILLYFTPANAGLAFKKDDVDSSFVVYSVGPGEQAVDDIERGFSAMFIDALASANPNEDVALTIRRTRANLKHQSAPAVVDLLDGTASLNNTNREKKALLVAVASYATGALTAPVHDTRRLDKILQRMHYQTDILIDPSQNEFSLILDKFAQGLQPGDQAVFYFSGRGFDYSETAYLVLKDKETPINLEAYMQSAVSFEKVHKKIAEKVQNAIFILDIDRSELNDAVSTRNSR